MPFRVPTSLHLRPGSLSQLPATVTALGPGRVTVVVDPGLAATAWPRQALALLVDQGVDAVLFDAIGSNPRDTQIEHLAAVLKDNGTAVVVGLGGGSVLDAAKAAAMLATNEGRCVEYEGRNRFVRPALPFVAIPTTCGTGSEVTWVSVITVEERRAKISVKGDGMYPRAALVDADLLATLPASLVAWTGVDALTHALEATTGRLANPASDALAEKAIDLLYRFLPRAVADVAGDGEAREAVMTASTLAGLAFGNADVAAVHCLSETLGGLYDVPHGLANAVLLAPVMRAHGASIQPRLAALAPTLAGADERAHAGAPAARAEAALLGLEDLVSRLGVPPFSSFAVPGEDFAEIARRAVANGSNGSSPRAMGETEYREILDQLS